MKYLQRLLALLTISIAIFSCQKEYSVENNGGNSNATAQWEFKEAGVQFKGPLDSASVDTLGGYKFLTINGRSSDGTAQITLQVFGADLKVGTYKTPFSLFAYIQGGSPVYQTDQTAADSFSIVITKIDSFGVTGTFSGNALSGTSVKKIVDGKFSAVIKSSAVVPPATADSGNVVLWSKAGCGGGTSTTAINVSVGGKAGQITSFSATEPTTCDPSGTYHLKLPVGTYPWIAKCGTDSVTGVLVVTKNGCTKQLVDFTAPVVTTDYFPTTLNSYWAAIYDPALKPSDSAVTISTGSAFFSGTAYNAFTYYDFKDSIYYYEYFRKGGGLYYQYYSDTDNIFGFDIPQPVEFIFLKDNVNAGTSWSTTPVSGTKNNGTPLTVRIDCTVLEKGVNVTVGGKAYTNVIKVRNSYLAGASSSTLTEQYRVEQWYAYGIGLVKYQEFLLPDVTTPITVQNTYWYYIAP